MDHNNQEVDNKYSSYEGPKYWRDSGSTAGTKLAVGILIVALLCMAISVPFFFF